MATQDNIKHIVVLMMENRSFDHMLGFAGTDTWKITGLSGTEQNEASDGTVVRVSNDANYAGDLTPDPGHSGFDTLTQLYENSATPVSDDPQMTGFVKSYEGKTSSTRDAGRIMKCFAAAKLSVLTRLAQQFCICDHWYSSLPGPTFPNRAFVHAATSLGRVDMSPDWRNLSPTIYERLKQFGLDSVIYYHDSTMASTFDSLAGDPNYFGSLVDDFLPACQNDDLPPYSLLEPRFANSPGGNGEPAYSASDQHPDHNVQEGEALIQRVFNAIWNNPVRNSTLLVIVYDEHGGTYDHVRPPQSVNPDGKVWQNDGISIDPSFDFTRLGVRVPAVLVSPYIKPGTVDHTIYDHTSIIATAFKILLPGIPNVNLTERDRNANTLEANLTLLQPRKDKPNLGPDVPSRPPTAAELSQPINDHLRKLVQQAALSEKRLRPEQQTGIDPNTIQTEAQASVYLKAVHSKLHSKNGD